MRKNAWKFVFALLVSVAFSALQGPLAAQSLSITSLSPSSGCVGTSVAITGTGFGSTQGTSTIKFGSTAAAIASWSSTSVTAIVPQTLATGTYAVVATVGGVASNGTNFLVTPCIASVTPAIAPTNAPVNIRGTDFGSSQGTGTVTIDGFSATPISWQSTSIVVPVPSGANTGPVVVTVNGVASNSVTLTTAPSIGAISPISGTGGTVVTLTGTNFGSTQGTSIVTFGGVPATANSWSNMSIVVSAPSGVSTGLVQIGAGDYTSNGITFSTTPVITALSPSGGPAGTTVTIAGSNFGASQNQSIVIFNGTPAPISAWSATQIVTTAPTVTTGPVVVQVAGLNSNGVTFTVGTGTLSGVISSGGNPVSGATVKALQSNVVVASTSSGSNGSYSLGNLTQGTYDLVVSASGLGTAVQQGNSVTAGGTTTVNLSLSSPGTLAGQVTQSIGSTGISGASVTVIESGDTVATTLSNSSGNYTISNLSPGTYTVQISASGFSGQTQTGVTITGGNTTTENFSLAGQSVVLYTYDELGRLVGAADLLSDVVGYQYDAVGNVVSIARSHSSQVFVVDFTPKTGTAGTTVTITGTGFSTTASQNTVTFNTSTATVISSTANQIVVTVPTSATTGAITVSAPAGTATSSGSFTFGATTGVPTISSFSPSIGLAGSTLTISGTNFNTTSANDRTTLNSLFATVSSATTTAITATMPINVTSGHLAVATAYGQTVTSGYFYVAPSGYTVGAVAYTGSITYGGNANVAIGTAGQIGLLVFDATAGDTVNVAGTGNTFGGCGATLSLLTPTGASLISTTTGCGSPFSNVVLPRTGSYTVEVLSGSTTGAVTLTLTRDSSNALPYNTPVTVSNSIVGQNVPLTFSGESGEIINLAAYNNTYTHGCGASLTALNPDGSQLTSGNTDCSFGFFNVTLAQTGTYTVIMSPGVYTGSVTLLLTQNQNVGSVSFSTADSIGNTLAGQTIDFTFSGSSGQIINLAAYNNTYTHSCGATLTALNPNGSQLTTGNTGCSFGFFNVTLTQTGTYTVIVSPSIYTGTATFMLTQNQNAGSLSFNTADSIGNTLAGQTIDFTFSGSSGQIINLADYSNTYTHGCGASLTVLNPSGSQLTTGNTDCSFGFFNVTLTQTGTYTVVMSPSIYTGTATFMLTQNQNAGSLSFNTADTVGNTLIGQTIDLTFSGTSGEVINLGSYNNSYNAGCGAGLAIYNPDNSTLSSTSTGCNDGVFNKTLAQTGSYTVVLTPGSSTGATTLMLTQNQTGTISFGTPLSVGSTLAGQTIDLTFSGTANQVVTLTPSSNTYDTSGCGVGLAILNPSGSTLASTNTGCGDTISNKTLGSTGTYTVVISPADYTGSVTLTLTN